MLNEFPISLIIDHWFISLVVIFLLCVAVRDILQKPHTIKHNFPIIGHIRYWGEKIGPELRQYWVAHDREEMPFNRTERSWIYQSAKGQPNTIGFGTNELLNAERFPIIKHSVFPFSHEETGFDNELSEIPCLKVMGMSHKRRRLYSPTSIINISALSYGSLGKNAISALNKGALVANCYHNTGEGGISPYHTYGADLMWQLGTGYFGSRNPEGSFSWEIFEEKIKLHPYIRCIEIKLSQGAKPGKGGILPAKKVTAEIAEIRGVEPGVECLSPNAHSQFGDVDGLIDFVERLADVSGLPVGIKSAVGKIEFWSELANRMKQRGEGPDFITIDGAEGGTGAAPLVFADHVALPFNIGFSRVYKIFQQGGISKDIIWIGSSKLGFPDRAIIALAMGCDMIQIAREAMMAIGCIQAMRCHHNTCPSGIATQNRWLQAGLDVEDKAERFSTFVKNFRKELLHLAYASRYKHPCQFTSDDIELSTGKIGFVTLADHFGYSCDPVDMEMLNDYFSSD